ncbi:chalcone isomerase family protein [Collimonas sp.]|jgi:hypothetical protein|uniref:chalcone isomerase family protein n=1 Tax=Collimonas sp. TaxID=1963772 RepID=UPI0037BE41EA
MPIRLCFGLFFGLLLTMPGMGTASANTSDALDARSIAPPHIEQAIPEARLAGQGSFRWFGLLIYDAQFWVGSQDYQASNPDTAPFALDLEYARSLNGEKIAEASIEEIKKIGGFSDASYDRWLLQMKGVFKNVVKGTHITGVFIPNYGARFFYDGKALGEIADLQFAHAFFSIWLSPKTSAPALRKKLLANAEQR